MKPTFVFVCGAWHTISYFEPLIDTLSARGYASIAVTPRCVNSSPPASSFQPDVDAVKEAIISLVERGTDVIVAMHSYGGSVGTEAVGSLVDIDRDYAARIKRLVYLVSTFPIPGQTVVECAAGLGPPLPAVNDEGNVVLPQAAIEAQYHDVPEPQRSTYTSKLQGASMSAGVCNSYLSHYGWRHVPTTYVHATLDPIVPPTLQEFIVNMTRNRAAMRGSEASVTPFSGPLGTFTVEAGHSLILSRTEEVAEILCRVARES